MSFIEIDLNIKGITAFYTTRSGGESKGIYSSLNFAKHVGDDPQIVQKNRNKITVTFPFIQQAWPRQVHGNEVLEFDNICDFPDYVEADGITTIYQRQLCLVQTADCLPILLASKDGLRVAAVHAGWRGLLSGVIENTLCYFHGAAVAYIGAGICQQCFEVGQDVKELFISKDHEYAKAFIAFNQDKYYLFDYKSIAKAILKKAKVEILDSKLCTCCDKNQFFSYRRDGKTGRQITGIMKV